MEACKKEFTELSYTKRQQGDAVVTMRNKEELVYTTTEKGAEYRANQNMRQQLLSEDEKLYKQDDQLSNIMQLGQATIDTMNNANQDLRQQRDIIGNVAEKNAYANSKVAETGSVVN